MSNSPHKRSKLSSTITSRNVFRKHKQRTRSSNPNEFDGDEVCHPTSRLFFLLHFLQASKTLFSACKSGNIKKIQKIVKKKPGSVNGSNSAVCFRSPLFFAFLTFCIVSKYCVTHYSNKWERGGSEIFVTAKCER